MRNNNLVLVLSLGAVFVVSSSLAATGKELYASKTCVACHGPEGRKPIMPDYPKIAGQNKDYLVRQMTDIKEQKRTNGNSAAMAGVMHLVSTEEITILADYLSKLKP